MAPVRRLRLDHPDEAGALAAVAEVRRLEQRYSRQLPDSLVARINRAAGHRPVEIDAETAALLDYADTAWRERDGMFDITSGVLRRAWNFSAGALPQPAQLAPPLPLVGWRQLQRSARQVYLSAPGIALVFGGCIKEYAANNALAKLSRAGVHRALVGLTGDNATLGPQGKGLPGRSVLAIRGSRPGLWSGWHWPGGPWPAAATTPAVSKSGASGSATYTIRAAAGQSAAWLRSGRWRPNAWWPVVRRRWPC